MKAVSLEKRYEPSHIRRGRLSTSPTWWVTTDSGEQWRFQRKKDAQAFITRGGQCPHHGQIRCDTCNGMNVTVRREMRA